MKNSFIILFSLLFLSSCGSESIEKSLSESPKEKAPFIVKTEKLSDFSGATIIEKSGRITASSSLTLSAKSSGDISRILVQEGQYVKPGSTIATLRDTQNNYDLRLEQAENTLAQQNASIMVTEANMNTSIDAARAGLSRARLAYENANSRKNIQSLTLSTTNQRTIDSYNILYKNYLSDLERQMTQMLYSGDKILGITTNFEYANDPWQSSLGARNSGTYATALSLWNKLYGARGELRARIEKGTYITAGSAYDDLEYISKSYDKTQEFADGMIAMLQNNVVGAGLPQVMQDGWTTEWNAIRAQIQASLSGYGGWKAQVLAFLRTYESTEKATDLAIASITRALTPEEKSIIEGSSDMRVTYENTRTNLRESIENTKLSLEQAENAYGNALTVKDATLTQMRVMRANAEIALAQARRDYAKLAITAPVEGVITKLRTSVGEAVNPGSPIAEFAGKKPEVIIDIDPLLAKSLSVGDRVSLLTNGVSLSGNISAVSGVAGSNLLSTVRISVPTGEKYIGQSVVISFQSVGIIEEGNALLPIDAIKILSEGEGEIALLTKDNAIIKKTVKIEDIGGAHVTISGDISPGDIVIISDISNFDPEKHILKIQ